MKWHYEFTSVLIISSVSAILKVVRLCLSLMLSPNPEHMDLVVGYLNNFLVVGYHCLVISVESGLSLYDTLLTDSGHLLLFQCDNATIGPAQLSRLYR